jgi:CheY-like chemotaxis protein
MDTNSDPYCVLLVEDDALVMQTTQAVLQRLGFSVLTAESPHDAITICNAGLERIDLVITDIVMPEMNGMALRDRLLTLQPGIKVLFTSGHPYEVIVREYALKPGEHFIQKPFSLNSLKDKINAVLAD